MTPRWEPDDNIRRGRTVVWNIHAHLVFVTKYRREVLTDEMLTRCETVMTEVCRSFGAELFEFNGEDDHVHLLVHYPPSIALSALVNSLKGVSARYLRAEYSRHLSKKMWGSHLWSPSYFAASAGGAPLSIIAEYIANQKRPISTT